MGKTVNFVGHSGHQIRKKDWFCLDCKTTLIESYSNTNSSKSELDEILSDLLWDIADVHPEHRQPMKNRAKAAIDAYCQQRIIAELVIVKLNPHTINNLEFRKYIDDRLAKYKASKGEL